MWEGESALRGHAENVRSLSLNTQTSERIHWAVDWLFKLQVSCCLEELSVAYVGQGWPSPTAIDHYQPTFKLGPFSNQLHAVSLKKLYADWTECTFDRLCVLKLSDINTLDADSFAHILATSPMLQVLELTRVRLSSRLESELVIPPNLKSLRLCCISGYPLGYILQVLAPGTYNIKLYVDKVSFLDSNVRRPKFRDRISKMTHAIRQITHNITVLGVGCDVDILGPVLIAVAVTLPNLTNLRLEDVELFRSGLAGIEDMIKKLPHIKTVQVTLARVADIGSFKDVIQR
ncbi:unnamed protein product [Rhizoctonia solani]|uniref:Uncharacterized protein n=1 Tax=Rhizoctonia solani TaxID=456999 RepID=A0A8H3ALU2_9AGAM|nr:unnamed protein product [Rhizoctonia solani]